MELSLKRLTQIKQNLKHHYLSNNRPLVVTFIEMPIIESYLKNIFKKIEYDKDII